MPIGFFFIPALDPKRLFFFKKKISSCGMRMHISMQTEVQNGHRSYLKNNDSLLKLLFLKLPFLMNITCMPTVRFILRVLILNAFFFSSLVVAYVCIFPS